MNLRNPTRLLLAGALCLLTLSCNTYPVHSLLENFRVRVTDKLSADEAVKLDFLWVIDHSASMCQEQRDLAKGFKSFIEQLQSLGSIDAQMAVVTVQQVQDKSEIKVVGRFMHNPAQALPANCMERVRYPCLTDGECAQPRTFTFPQPTDSTLCEPASKQFTPAFPNTSWRCVAPSAASNLANVNCSLNSYCVARCKDITNHTDCRAMFEPNVPKDKQRIKCVIPGGGTNLDQAGCLFPPESDGCPPADQLPPVLKSDQLDLFRCNATLGAGQLFEAGFEGGFRSAWTALDPNGPNCSYDACVAHLRSCCTDGGAWCKDDQNDAKCAKDKAEMCEMLKDEKNCQHRALVRDGAYLVIVFVSDDDDCSVDPDKNPLDKSVITKEVWGSCQRLGDQLAGNYALNEGNCEFKRGKDANVYCPSDCAEGSTKKDSSGKLKCPNGCKDGGAEQVACMAKVDEGFDKMVRVHPAIPPVGRWVNLFKSLKPDPARVIIAAIAGDTLETDNAAQAFRDRVNYYNSTFKDVAPKQVPYVCEGSRGEAGYGSRYVEMAQSFGDNGVVQNICKGSDFGAALENIATTILKRVVKVCLPQPPFEEEGVPQLTVTRTRNGTAEVMEYTDGPQAGNDKSFYIAPSPDCRAGKADLPGQLAACKVTRDCSAGLTCIDGLCQAYNDAIFFSEVPDPTDVIEINYAADLGL